jgi:hypothetical protein
MRWLLIGLLVACSSKTPSTNNGSGGGNGTSEPPATGCDGAKKKIEGLYRAESVAKQDKPERTEEAVADNTHMVMAECAKSPDKVVSCINKVSSSAELEAQCLAKLDEEGTEGEALRK